MSLALGSSLREIPTRGELEERHERPEEHAGGDRVGRGVCGIAVNQLERAVRQPIGEEHEDRDRHRCGWGHLDLRERPRRRVGLRGFLENLTTQTFGCYGVADTNPSLDRERGKPDAAGSQQDAEGIDLIAHGLHDKDSEADQDQQCEGCMSRRRGLSLACLVSQGDSQTSFGWVYGRLAASCESDYAANGPVIEGLHRLDELDGWLYTVRCVEPHAPPSHRSKCIDQCSIDDTLLAIRSAEHRGAVAVESFCGEGLNVCDP